MDGHKGAEKKLQGERIQGHRERDTGCRGGGKGVQRQG